MNHPKLTREQRRWMERENAKWPLQLREVPREDWPQQMPPLLLSVYRSSAFLVQVFGAPAPAEFRLSVSRTDPPRNGRWVEGITWDDLQRLKGECGFGDRDAVEVYPCDRDVVNVANIRHLWIMREPLTFKWGAP